MKNSKKCPNFLNYQASQRNKENVPPRQKAVPVRRPAQPARQQPRFRPLAGNDDQDEDGSEDDEDEEEEEDGGGNAFNFGEWEQVEEDEEVLPNNLGVIEIEGTFNDAFSGLQEEIAHLSVIDLYYYFIGGLLPSLIAVLNQIIQDHKISSTKVTAAMFFAWISIYFHMMNFPRRSIGHYWGKVNPDAFIRSTCLSKKKFLSIFRAMYHLPVEFLDLMEKSLNLTFISCWVPSRFVSIDEIMRKFKGRCRHKCYEPSKPTKWGLKYYAMLDGLGWCCRFQRHRAGVKVNLRELCLNFVTSLDQELGSYCLFADNYYGSIQLGMDLSALGHKFFFTMRKNRTKAIWNGYGNKNLEAYFI